MGKIPPPLKNHPHARGAQGRGGVGILFVRRRGVQILLLQDDGRRDPPGLPPSFPPSAIRSEGNGAILIISKNLPLKGKFFEMVSRALPPRGVWGAWPPQESPLITRALPPHRPCLAPVPCPQFFSSEFFSSEFFSSVVGPSSVRI